MEKRKSRIAEFIESLNESGISSSFVLGGSSKKKQEDEANKNGRSCINDTYEGCNKSTNEGSCLNSSTKCNDSINRGHCNNNYNPEKTILAIFF